MIRGKDEDFKTWNIFSTWIPFAVMYSKVTMLLPTKYDDN